MRWISGMLCVAALLVGGPSHAGETREKAQAAEDKAEVLEEKAASQAPIPADTPPITRSEARAVDPDGEAPLDDPITCLARSIYWEAKGAPAQDMESVANVVMNRLGDGAFPRPSARWSSKARKAAAASSPGGAMVAPTKPWRTTASPSPGRSPARR